MGLCGGRGDAWLCLAMVGFGLGLGDGMMVTWWIPVVMALCFDGHGFSALAVALWMVLQPLGALRVMVVPWLGGRDLKP